PVAPAMTIEPAKQREAIEDRRQRQPGVEPQIPAARRCHPRRHRFRKYLICHCCTLRLCSASVEANTWVPSLRLTKYRYLSDEGWTAASRDARPGEAIGPGGRPA